MSSFPPWFRIPEKCRRFLRVFSHPPRHAAPRRGGLGPSRCRVCFRLAGEQQIQRPVPGPGPGPGRPGHESIEVQLGVLSVGPEPEPAKSLTFHLPAPALAARGVQHAAMIVADRPLFGEWPQGGRRRARSRWLFYRAPPGLAAFVRPPAIRPPVALCPICASFQKVALTPPGQGGLRCLVFFFSLRALRAKAALTEPHRGLLRLSSRCPASCCEVLLLRPGIETKTPVSASPWWLRSPPFRSPQGVCPRSPRAASKHRSGMRCEVWWCGAAQCTAC